MSRFFSEKYAALTPYVPGEQPRDMQYLKLNTNESPYPPLPEVVEAAREEAARAHLYSDPTALALRQALAKRYGVTPDMVVAVNGSDEALNFAFMAFCDREHPAVFADITYGFYPVFANVNGIPYEEIPLRDDFTLDPEDYVRRPGKTVFIANPNAPTGLLLPLADVERIAASDPSRVVVIDEAYIDFGGESAIRLIPEYPNLLVTRTFSKSRSLAGARLGFAVGQPALIADLETLRNSTNPYNVNRMTLAMGAASLAHDDVNMQNCMTVAGVRDRAAEELRGLGFLVTDSKTNFLFARHPAVEGEMLYKKLRERGILVRHFSLPRIAAYNRITVGTAEQMKTFTAAVREILEDPS